MQYGAAIAGPSLNSGLQADALLRSVLALAAFLLCWIGLQPFLDLTDPANFRPSTSAGFLNSAAIMLLAAAMGAVLVRGGIHRVMPVATLALTLLVAWLALNVVMSAYPVSTARRFAVTLCLFAIAVSFVQLPRNSRHFAAILAVGALGVLALSYAGLMLAPGRAMHTVADLGEPEHAGNWRGHFSHKNTAGAASAVLIIIGLYVARARSLALGALIVVAAAIFLVFSAAKTPAGILPVVLVCAAVIARLPGLAWRMAFVAALVIFINLLSLGSVVFPSIRAVLDRVLPDPTFTGRDQVWHFAIGEASARPLFGYGLEAFWGTNEVAHGGGGIETWANATVSAHQAYLEVILTLGLPGLALTIVWAVIQPVRDYARSRALGNDPVLALLYLRLWLFTIVLGSMESGFFSSFEPIWFSFLIAVFGLRFHATMTLAPGGR